MAKPIGWQKLLSQVTRSPTWGKLRSAQPAHQIQRPPSPEAFQELTGGGSVACTPPLWRASGKGNGPPGIPSSAPDASFMGTIVDTAFDGTVSREVRMEAQRKLDTLLEEHDLARMFWQGACLRTLGATVKAGEATTDDETARRIYNVMLGHIVDNRTDSPLYYAAKTFLTYMRIGFEHVLPPLCVEKAARIRKSFADHGLSESDLERLIYDVREISTKYRMVLSWVKPNSDEIVGETDELVDMLRRGNAAQAMFAMRSMPLVMQGALSPGSPKLVEIADSLHQIMLFSIRPHNYRGAMTVFAQIRGILPPERVEYVESNLGVQEGEYLDVLDYVLTERPI